MNLRHRHRQVFQKKESNPGVEEGSEEGIKATWIELNFKKRECIKFVPAYSHDGIERCGCGRLQSSHSFLDSYGSAKDLWIAERNSTKYECKNEISRTSHLNKSTLSGHHIRQYSTEKNLSAPKETKWNVLRNTSALPTDAHGILEFQGTGEGDKSQFIRLAHDTHPDLTLRLLTEEWGLQLPKMVITVHGSAHNFQLQPKLRRLFCDGLIKAAKTTGAWIMLFGLNTGIGSIVGNALKEHKAKSRGKICSIGVAPWGVVDNREDLVGPQGISSYQTMADPLSKGAVLHAAHTHFLLVDNGTEGRYDSELKFRRRLERRLSMQLINSKHSRKIPVVCLVLEGGKNTINVVLESVRQTPPIPVIVVDGSGRAADLLAFAHQYAEDDGTMMEELRVQLLFTIQNTFSCEREQAQYIFLTIMECVRKKDLITVFRLGQGHGKIDDIDNAILTASLKARRTSAPDMLSLALTWNRIDIATNQIFVYGQHWPVLSLEQAMMDALTQDRVDFVKLLMENGVSMHKFLTIPRLEELYNIKQIPVHLLYLLQDVKKNITLGCRFNLIEIGQVIESLMGGAYRCNYTRKRFRLYYACQAKVNCNMKKPPSFSKNLLPGNRSKLDMANSIREFANSSSVIKVDPASNTKQQQQQQPPIPKDFQYPFHELMVWAVLMKRQKMALFMWQHGEEAIAKALVAAKLYKTMAREAADDDLELEEMEVLKNYASEFQDLATKVLEICYRADTDAAQHLLTYELKQWSRHTCLSLAIAAGHRDFIAHPCVQMLLNDLWMGGLNVRRNSSLRVILGLLLPPSLFTLQFKSQEELKLMPQTMEEHMDERSDSISISSSSSSSLSSSTSSSSSSSSSTASSITSGLQPKPEVVGRGATGLDQSNQPPQDAYLVFMAQQRQLSVSKKLYEFYNAPITKFWLYTLFYNAFLLMFTYVVLVAMLPMPSVIEWLVISYTFALALEKIREIAASEPSGAFHKIRVWSSHFWHQVDIVLLVMFFIGFTLRMQQDPYLLRIGRVIYCVNVTLWYIRLLNIFSVSKYLGPYVMMMGKMMVDLGTFITLLAVVLLSFGVTRQAILHPNEEPSWKLARDVLLEPYFMLYGEVYAGTIDPCDGEEKALCVVGSWIVPTAMTLYLLVANILLLNMLIAVFNNTFTKVKNISDKIWKFHRYGMIVEYESRPMLPPPLIIISYLVMILQLCFKKRKNSIFNSDRGLKLFLDDDDVEKLHDFEEDCLDDFFRQRDAKRKESSDFDIRNLSPDRIENFLSYIDDAADRDYALQAQLHVLEERQMQLAEMNIHLLSMIPQLAGSSDRDESDSDQGSEGNRMDQMNLNMIRQRMKLQRLRRLRQDSEMSEWHPSNLLFPRFKSHHGHRSCMRERHISEQVSAKAVPDYKLRKTSSTGNILQQKLAAPDTVMSSTTLITASSQNSDSCHKLSANLEPKSVSCQDIMMLKDTNAQYEDKIHPLPLNNDVVSGSEFQPSDYFDEKSPDVSRVEHPKPHSPPTDKRPGIKWKVSSDRALDERFMQKHTEDGHESTSSGDETSCSSISEDEVKFKTSSLERKKRSPERRRKKLRRKNTPCLPTLVINSPESSRPRTVVNGLTPVSERFLNASVAPSNTFPLLNMSSASASRVMDPSNHRNPAASIYYCTPSTVRKNTHQQLPLYQSPNTSSQMYKSITDCIDTSRWHDANAPVPPTTPFESWARKPPDFTTTHEPRSHMFSVTVTSQDEWEDENSPLGKKTRKLKISRGQNSKRGHRKGRLRLYSNNSSSSIKSGSSRRAGRGSRKSRHKRRKKLRKGLGENLQMQVNPDDSDVQISLATLPEKSSPVASNYSSVPGPSAKNTNNNAGSVSVSQRLTTDSSFLSRYANILLGNGTLPGPENKVPMVENGLLQRKKETSITIESDTERSPLISGDK